MGEDSKEIRITYETLYEVLRREKSKDELQKLDESFFRDVLEYLQEKTRIVQEAAGKFDMFSVEERENTQIQLNNVRRILKELYERREKKIIDMALNKSKTNSNIIDTTNLLAKEHELYNETVGILDSFRKDILLRLLELKAPEIKQLDSGTVQAGPVPEPPAPEPAPPPVPAPVPEPEPASDMIKVKFLQKVEQFVGKELELYGPFEPDSSAELPKEIADILVNKGSAYIAE
jgi:DNA replication initiation complex subunit (GINS family)